MISKKFCLTASYCEVSRDLTAYQNSFVRFFVQSSGRNFTEFAISSWTSMN